MREETISRINNCVKDFRRECPKCHGIKWELFSVENRRYHKNYVLYSCKIFCINCAAKINYKLAIPKNITQANFIKKREKINIKNCKLVSDIELFNKCCVIDKGKICNRKQFKGSIYCKKHYEELEKFWAVTFKKICDEVSNEVDKDLIVKMRYGL